MTTKMEHQDNLYRRIVDNSEDGIWLIDDQYITTFVNEKMASMLGYSCQEMVGKDISHFMSKDRIGIAKEGLQHRKNGIKENHDFILLNKAGKKVWTSMAASPIKDEQGNFIGALAMITEISERRKSETLLLAQRKIFEHLVMDAPLNTALVELTSAIEFLLDNVTASILLLDEEGTRLWEGAAPGLPRGYNDAINGALIGPKNGSCGTSAYDKRIVVVSDIFTDPLWEDYRDLAFKYDLRSCWSSPILSRDNKVLGTFAVYTNTVRFPDEYEMQLIKDATAASALSIEHKRAQLNLKKSRDNANFLCEARKSLSSSLDYESVLKEIPKMIVSHFADWCFLCQMDKEGSLHAMSWAAETFKVPLVKKLENYLPDMEAPEGLPRAIRTKESILYKNITAEQLIPGTNGWPPVIGTRDPEILKIIGQLGLTSYMAVPMIIRGKAVGALLIATGMTGKNYNQFDLQLANELAHSCAMAVDNAILFRESQQGIAAREVFISVASHEFRTPLTILRGRIDLLARIITKNSLPPELDKSIQSTLQGLNTQSNKIAKLVDALLDVSKIGTDKLFLNMEQVNLSELIVDITGRLVPEFEAKQCPLKVNIQKDIYGKWDSLRIEQVIINLLSNALKFAYHKPVEVNVSANNSRVIIEVRDQGPGIPLKDQQRIFECFERASSARHYGGLGLGLYITKQIVIAHGGRLKLVSRPGEGASFIVELPLGNQLLT